MQILLFYENTNTFFLPRVERIKFPHILHLDDIETKDTQFNLSAVFLEPLRGLLSVATLCPFYCVPEHDSYHGKTGWMQAC